MSIERTQLISQKLKAIKILHKCGKEIDLVDYQKDKNFIGFCFNCFEWVKIKVKNHAN